MSDFGILESQYRLIETQFLDDWVVFKAVEIETNRIVSIRTPSDRFLADAQRYEAFERDAARLTDDAAAASRYHPPGTFDERGYVVSTWVDVTLEDLLNERDVLTPERTFQLQKDLEPGEITDVLRSSNGFHILKLNDKRGGSPRKSVTQTHARHILLKPNEILTENEARIRLNQLKVRIENGEDFAALARAYSEDTASALTGGELGWVNPGSMIPEFEQAMDSLKPNEISQPIETAFGFHLIQVLERRKQDISDELDRAGARQQIHSRKADERYEQWVRQLRDEAYVEFLGEELNLSTRP